MDLTVEGLNGVKHTVELGEDDTPADMRRKVASAVGLPEDGFDISFGDEAMYEGYDMTQLSAGDTIVVEKKSKKPEAMAALRELGVTDLTLGRLDQASRAVSQDAEVACLLLQAEVTTIIPAVFLPFASITQLDLSAVSTVTRIEKHFLNGCTRLTSVDLSSLNELRHIGDDFLRSSTTLTSLDLPSLNWLEYIGDRFLEHCTRLTSLDLSSANSLTHVGSAFLYNCASLVDIDLSSLENVTHICQRFLCECASLRTIRLSGCSAVMSSAVEEANLMKYVVDAGFGFDKA